MAGLIDRLSAAAERVLAETGEGTLVLSILAAFVVLWMIFLTVSTASLDVHFDASEASMWAQHFAFGYKHPPMTGWLFELWFAVFPRQKWAVDLLVVTTITAALAITWQLLRDHLDKNRALIGLFALILIPLYDVKAEVLNANTVMIPFWAATVLFYLRARRGLGIFDAFLAGAFASFTVLGKYWAVFLLAGIAVATLIGPGVRRFWHSPAPYVIALGAAIVIAPHVWWILNDRVSLQFAESVVTHVSFGSTVIRTIKYIGGAVAYISGPLVFLAALRPSRTAMADIAWPAEEGRRQALLLLVVPLVLPALANLAIPYRLTPDWTFPNWALLPIVLYGSRQIRVDQRAAARAGLFALAATLVVVIVSPAIACVRLMTAHDRYRTHFRQVAEFAERFAAQPIQRIWGSSDLVAGLPFYLPGSQTQQNAQANAGTLLIVCVIEDASCRAAADRYMHTEKARTTTATFTRSFLGFSNAPLTVQITVVPPSPADMHGAR
jgi:hypothetical protein